VNSIQIDLSGTGIPADIVNVEIWHDVNSDDVVDVGDALLGSGTFAGGPPPTVTIMLGGGFPVSFGTPETLLVVYDISGVATQGNTVGARIEDQSYVLVAGPDNVNAFGSLQSMNSEILVPTDVLTVMGWDLTSPTAYPGEVNVTLTRLILSAGSGEVNITQIDIFMFGTSADADIALANLYDDADDSGTLNAGDPLVDSATIAGGSASFTGFTYTVTSGVGESLIIAFDVSPSATIGRIFAMVIMSNANITVTGFDIVAPNNFPIGTSLIEIIGGTITGTVTDTGGSPIVGANVQLIDTGTGTIVDVEATDSSGNFAFANQPFDDYTLNASATGYDHNDTAIATISLGTPTTNAGTIQLSKVTVTPPQPTEGEVEGNVYDKDGEPVADATVELLDDNGNVVETDTTNSQGHYKFSGLTFGTYSVRISKSGLVSQTSKEFTLDADNPLKGLESTMTTTPATTPETEEVVPMWAWLLIIVFLILFVVSLLLFLFGRKKKPDIVAPPELLQPSTEAPAETPPSTPPGEPDAGPQPAPGEPSEPAPALPGEPGEVPPPPPTQ
jgi:protocatechuate 3,4-dioxygenase beta subunit